MRSAVLAVALLSLAPASALAAPAHHDRGPTASAKSADDAEPIEMQVARAVFPREDWSRLMEEASAELARQIAEKGKGRIELAPEFADRLRFEYELLVPYEDIIRFQASVLESQYSKAELRQLLAFYTSPLGRKSAPLLRDLLTSSVQRTQLKVQGGIAEALMLLRPLVRVVPDHEPSSAEQDEARPGQQPHAEGGDVPEGGAGETASTASAGNAF